MPNHFHLLIEQTGDISISKLVLKLCTSYSRYLNKKYKRVGHVFQDQFKSVKINRDAQLMWCSSYIHMNPVKDGLVNHPNNYPWSSYQDYVSERDLPMITKEFLLETFGDLKNFKKQTLSLSTKYVNYVKGHL